MEVTNEIDSDNEIKTLLLKILKKLSNKSYKKVEATHEDLNVTHSESDSKLKPKPIGLNHDNVFGGELDSKKIDDLLGFHHSIYPGRPCKILTGAKSVVKRKMNQ